MDVLPCAPVSLCVCGRLLWLSMFFFSTCVLLFEPKTEAVYNSVLVWLLFDEETVTGVTRVVFV